MKRSAAGFTLLELLVGIGLMAILSVLGYRGLDNMLRSRDDLSRRDEALALLAQTWIWLERDFSALLPESNAAVALPRLVISRDEKGQSVLVLTTVPVAADGRRVPHTVTYRLAEGRLERRERLAGADAEKGAQDDALRLVQAGVWQAEPWGRGRGWATGNAFEIASPAAIKVSFAVSGSTYVRIFTLRP